MDLVDDGATGILVAPGDPVGLATALSRVITDPEKAVDMGRNGLDRVRLFTASQVVGRIENLYERLVSGVPSQE